MMRIRQQRGSVAPFMVLALGGALLVTAYAIDTSLMTNSAAQIKRATDMAALAVGHERLANGDKPLEDFKKLAYGYVVNNLGLDSTLAAQIDQKKLALSEQKDDEGRTRYKVEVTFQADANMLGVEPRDIQIHSTAEVFNQSIEVALVLPNTGSEDEIELAAIRRLIQRFSRELIGEDQNKSDNIWISLVPFSQAVNVYDASDINRIRRWAATSAIRPKELTSLFRNENIRDLGDRRMPDPKTGLLCMHRGLRLGQNYFWDQPPAGQFTRVYYRHDLPANDPSAERISWIGPNPDFGQANGTEDTRWIIADKGCPRAPVLPLTNDIQKIDARLAMMRPAFNTNYAIALGWAGIDAFAGNARKQRLGEQ